MFVCLLHPIDLDFSNLTLSNAKQLEFDVKERIGELENELDKERKRLSEIRRRNYAEAADVEVIMGGMVVLLGLITNCILLLR